jgi:anti-sigma factor RsiW
MSAALDCPFFLSIVSGEREADLTPAESIAFESHLDACASCREAVARAEDDLDRLALLAEPPIVPEAAWARVDEAVRAQARTKPGREEPAPVIRLAPALPPRRGGLGLAVAAGLALVIGVFALSAKPPEPTRSRTDIGRVNPPEPDDVIVVVDPQYGEKYHGTMTLKDGRFVMLIDECR